ncbi:MAG: copper resistance protein B [Alphaproteobacteria bacterium]|nr:copper resistance protein B [Alphaproteobacteria bacterium]
MKRAIIMRTKGRIVVFLFVLACSTPALANEEHDSLLFHAFLFEGDYGQSDGRPTGSWDLDGWIGGDYNKLWLKSEGESNNNKMEQAEFWAMYSRNIATFWDAQIGIRHDVTPTSETYAVLGFGGLAPYFFDTEAHLFISQSGDVSIRLREENDFLITQRLIIQPYLEANFFAQKVDKQERSVGLAYGEAGLLTRYEITRKFAPYIDLRYERKFGETATIAKSNGEDIGSFIVAVGLRLMF